MSISAENIRLIFGLKLKELRSEKKMSLARLSKLTGISKSYINEIENGKKYPKPEKIARFAEAFGVSYEYLVSLKLNKRLSPISDLIRSNVLTELPLDFFGVEPIDLLNLLSAAPIEFTAFVDALIQVGTEYNIRVESLYFSVLRSYQEMHDNYFHEIELAAKATRKKQFANNDKNSLAGNIRTVLETNFKYDIDDDGIKDAEDMQSVRYIFIEGKKPKLLLNVNLNDQQKLFILARELGISTMNLNPRNFTSSWIDTQSFSHVLNNFKAYYFAGAIIMDERIFTKELIDFSKKPTISPSDVLSLMNKSQCSAEPFMLRITNLVPRYFRNTQLFFTRYNEVVKEKSFKMTKILHGSGLKRSAVPSLDIRACQRWATLNAFKILSAAQYDQPQCVICKVKFEENPDNYLVISIAQNMLPTKNMNSCTSVGFLINKRLIDKASFINDPSIPQHIVTRQWFIDQNMMVEDGVNKTTLLAQDHSTNQIKEGVRKIVESKS